MYGRTSCARNVLLQMVTSVTDSGTTLRYEGVCRCLWVVPSEVSMRCGKGLRQMIKSTVFLAILLLALPLVASAGSIDFNNNGGTLTGSSAGLTLTGSELTGVDGLDWKGLIQGSLGSVTIATGSLVSGSLTTGGVFNGGGSFVISGNGTNGVPNGVIFNGFFTEPVTWAVVSLANGTHNYTLSGALLGTWYNGNTILGATAQLTVVTGPSGFTGTTRISGGDTNFFTVGTPEPDSLVLISTGLISIAGIVRRKLKSA
jgi:hypothetical protein